MKYKQTKIEYLTGLREVVENAGWDKDKMTDYFEYIDREIAALNKKKANSLAKEVERQREIRDFAKTILDLIKEHDDFVTIADLLDEINDKTLTSQKVAARMAALIKEGIIEKKTIKKNGVRKVAYRKVADVETIEKE